MFVIKNVRFSAEIFKRNVYRLYFPSVDLGTTHGISVPFGYAQTHLYNKRTCNSMQEKDFFLTTLFKFIIKCIKITLIKLTFVSF